MRHRDSGCGYACDMCIIFFLFDRRPNFGRWKLCSIPPTCRQSATLHVIEYCIYLDTVGIGRALLYRSICLVFYRNVITVTTIAQKERYPQLYLISEISCMDSLHFIFLTCVFFCGYSAKQDTYKNSSPLNQAPTHVSTSKEHLDIIRQTTLHAI